MVVLSVAVLLWYRNAYVMPPDPSFPYAIPQPNGYDTLRDAGGLVVRDVDGVTTSLAISGKSPSLAARKKFLAANDPVLRRLRTALKQDFMLPLVTAQDDTRNLRHREFARLLAVAATVHGEKGDLPLAVQDAVDAIDLGRRLPRGGGIMDLLVGHSCEGFGEKALWEIADRLDAETAQGVIRRLEQIEGDRWPFENTLHGQDRLTYQDMGNLFEGGPVRSWNRVGEMFGEVSELNAFFSQMTGETDVPPPSLWERLSAWVSLTGTKAKIVYDGPRRTLDSTHRYLEALRARSEQPWSNPRPEIPLSSDTLGQIILPVYGQLEVKVVEKRAFSALLVTYLALRTYRLETGNYPDSLELLTAKSYLKALPVDPFSPTRALLGYRQEGPEGMVLWSVGPDATDDGGRPVMLADDPDKPRRGSVMREDQGDIVARVNIW